MNIRHEYKVKKIQKKTLYIEEYKKTAQCPKYSPLLYLIIKSSLK